MIVDKLSNLSRYAGLGKNFAAAARNLLAKAGMSEDNLDALTALLKK